MLKQQKQSELNYYDRSEVSNSDLSELKNYLEGNRVDYSSLASVFYFGNVFDAMITEPERVNYRNRTLDGINIENSIFDKIIKMKDSFMKDLFARELVKQSDKQSIIIDDVNLSFQGFPFTLRMRCKLDFNLSHSNLVADLKSTSSTTQIQFETAVKSFDYDRQAAVYMSLANVDRFAIVAVSKVNYKVFKVLITKDSDLYRSGMEKFTDLAFKWWTLFC